MWGDPKINVGKALMEKLEKAAMAKGYSSAEEFAVDALEKAVADQEDKIAEDQVRERLKGLGYVE